MWSAATRRSVKPVCSAGCPLLLSRRKRTEVGPEATPGGRAAKPHRLIGGALIRGNEGVVPREISGHQFILSIGRGMGSARLSPCTSPRVASDPLPRRVRYTTKKRMPPPGNPPRHGPPTLESLALAALARHITHASSLAGLPEDLSLRCWHAVLARGALTPAVLTLFKNLGHPAVDSAAAAVVRDEHAWTPPILFGGHRAWLGDKPPWQ